MLILHGIDHPRAAVHRLVRRRSWSRCRRSRGIPRMRALALREARIEFAEYYFLFPLFLSITLLTTAGFFDSMQRVVQHGINTLGPRTSRSPSSSARTFLSAILDNNVVADFASRGLHGLDIG